jgi:ribosomal protein S18 acetylase RimI-like enzyme
MPKIEIRPITPGDLSSLVEIDHGFRTHYVWQMDRTNDEGQVGVTFREIRLPREVRVEFPRPYRRVIENWDKLAAILVSVYNGEAVGYISLSEDLSPTTGWVTSLAVDAAHRRQGIASALILAAQDWARQRNNRRMILEMQSKNIPAIRLAEKLGYEFCGYNDHYYANQDIAIFFTQYLR